MKTAPSKTSKFIELHKDNEKELIQFMSTLLKRSLNTSREEEYVRSCMPEYYFLHPSCYSEKITSITEIEGIIKKAQSDFDAYTALSHISAAWCEFDKIPPEPIKLWMISVLKGEFKKPIKEKKFSYQLRKVILWDHMKMLNDVGIPKEKKTERAAKNKIYASEIIVKAALTAGLKDITINSVLDAYKEVEADQRKTRV